MKDTISFTNDFSFLSEYYVSYLAHLPSVFRIEKGFRTFKNGNSVLPK